MSVVQDQPAETNRERRWREPAAVYRLWDGSGNLLYIGSAYEPEHRCREHRKKPWWPEVARRTEEWCSNRGAAYVEEMKAIAVERPKYNVMGTPEYVTPDTAAIRRRNELSRARGQVQREAALLRRRVIDELKAQGAPILEACDAGERASFEYIEQSGLFSRWVAVEKARRAPRSEK